MLTNVQKNFHPFLSLYYNIFVNVCALPGSLTLYPTIQGHPRTQPLRYGLRPALYATPLQ